MAKNLNLKARWVDDDTIRVTWTDVKANDQMTAVAVFGGLAMVVGFVVSLLNNSFGGGAVSLIAGFVFLIWWRSGSHSVENQVDFTADTVTHQGRKYPTKEITRFEYGLTTALTGTSVKRDGKGNALSDPTLIRMWINDARAVEISSNNWQNQVNHEIRDQLSAALRTIREDQTKREQEAEHGKVGDLGMPDY